MNEFLKNRAQVDSATQWLRENNLTESGLSCKNWELAEATKELVSSDTLDMGADGSYILHNAVKRELIGRKVGIDLLEVSGTNKAEGVEYFKGDLMKTPFEDESFGMVTSLSVIEHEVNYRAFASEVSRLLRKGGKLIVSFDFSPVKIDTSLTKLYSLSWNILTTQDVRILIDTLADNGLVIDGAIDWQTEDMVINSAFCAPAPVNYTFGIFKFEKL